ncbi:MAG: hypothetical protein ACRD2H_11470 [Terriglobales bacterium]
MAVNPIDLCTVADVQAYLPPSTSPTNAAQIQENITAASQYICTECAVANFNTATYTSEVYDGTGSPRLYLKNYPITAVSALGVNGVAVLPSSGYGSPGYQFSDIGLILMPGTVLGPSTSLLSFAGTSMFSEGIRNVVVSYTAGFITIPSDLNQAAIELVAAMLTEARNVNLRSVSSAAAGAHGSTSFITAMCPVPPRAAKTIKNRTRTWGP